MNFSPDAELRIVSLYSDVMNVYADRGNLIAIRARAAQLGLPIEVFEVSLERFCPSFSPDTTRSGGGSPS